MARLAATAGLAWAILLVCVALGAGQPQGTGIEGQFPRGSLAPPVRIYCRDDPVLNLAVRGGKVVLARANCSDFSQKWHPMHTSPPPSGGPMPFSLMNSQTRQVITIPSGRGQVGLSSLSERDAAKAAAAVHEELWTAEKLTRADGFYRLFVAKDKRFTLQSWVPVQPGSLVGVYSASASSGNAIWQITSYPPCLNG